MRFVEINRNETTDDIIMYLNLTESKLSNIRIQQKYMYNVSICIFEYLEAIFTK